MTVVTISMLFLLSLFPRPTPALTFDASADLARRFDAVYDTLDDEHFPTILTPHDVENWINETVPFFSYEGVTDPTKENGTYAGAKYPESVTFEYYDTGQQHNHLLGRANCLSNDITINARVLNPTSPFYQRDDLLIVLVHELAHIQGICFSSETRLNVEVSAHLAALEVVAAMVNRGNKQAFGPLISELRSMSIASAYYTAQREGRLDDFDALHDELVTDPFVEATWEKGRRYWASDREHESYIIHAYSYVPISSLISAFATECRYTNIYWDKEIDDIVREPVVVPNVPCINGVDLPINQDVFEVPLIVDDLFYIFEQFAPT